MTLIRKIWPVVRMIFFLVTGLIFTLLSKEAHTGSFKNYLGYLLLTLAVYDVFVLLIIPVFKKPFPKVTL